MNNSKITLFQQYSLTLKLLKSRKDESAHHEVIAKIHYYKEMTEEYLENIEKTLRGNSHGESTIPSRLLESLKRTISEYNRLQESLKEPFKVFVVGPGKYGKSTLINSLIGTKEKFAPEGILPKTWKIDLYEPNIDINQVNLLYKDGTKKVISKKEAIEIITKEEHDIKQSKKKVKEKLIKERQTKELSRDEFKDLKLKYERDEVVRSELIEAQWGIPSNSLTEQISLVDTPGFNQENLSGDIVNNAKHYYRQAEGIIWLLDARTISASKSKELISELTNVEKEIGEHRSIDDKIAVLNFIDAVKGSEDEVISNAKRIYGDYFNTIIPYSAKNAYDGMISLDKQMLIDSGSNTLHSAIKNKFINNAQVIKSGKKDIACIELTNDLLGLVKDFNQELENDFINLNKYTSSLKETFVEESKRLENEYIHELNNYIKIVEAGLIDNLQAINQQKNKDPKYIGGLLFYLDTLKSLTDRTTKEIEESFHRLNEEANIQYNFFQYKFLEKPNKLSTSIAKIENVVLNTFDTYMPSLGQSAAYLGAVGLLFGPMGGLVGAGIGALISKSSRDSTINSCIAELDNITASASSNLHTTVNTHSKEVYKETIEHLNKKFENKYKIHSANVYRDIRELIDHNNQLIKKLESNDISFNTKAIELVLK